MYLRAVLIVLSITAALTLGVLLYSNLTAKNAASETTMPPDWPAKEITVPVQATDVVFDPDLRQAGTALKEVSRRMPSKYGRQQPFAGPWQIYFNDSRPLQIVFDHFEQPLLAAGYTKRAGRDLSQIGTYGIADQGYISPNGEVSIMVRYWASPATTKGNAANAQHWHVMITKR